MLAGMTATLATHVEHWARQMAESGTVLEAGPRHGAGLATACRGVAAQALPPALVAVARRLSEGDLASLEAQLLRSLSRVV